MQSSSTAASETGSEQQDKVGADVVLPRTVRRVNNVTHWAKMVAPMAVPVFASVSVSNRVFFFF